MQSINHISNKKIFLIQVYKIRSKKVFVTIALCLFAAMQLMAKPHTETIDGLNYFINTDTKEATLMYGDYSGDVKIPSSVTTSDGTVCTVVALVEGCFKESGITSVEIPSSVTSLPNECFYNCYSLRSIEIPSSVTVLGDRCFIGCSSLTNIEIPSSVTRLGNYCFNGCTSLTSIEIPSSVTGLGLCCFTGCSLTQIKCLAEKVPSIDIYEGEDAFYGLSTSTCLLYVPKQSLEAYKQDEHWGKFKYIYALDDNGGGTDTEKCEKPEISYANGALDFKSSTPGAKYHYTISDEDIKTDALDEDGHVELVATYNISAYTTADGYLPSDNTTATLMWLEANTDNPSTNINTTAKRGIVVKSEGGIVTISGLDEGERIEFMSVDGKVLGYATSVGGTASFSTSEQIVIVKIGSQSVKLAVK